MNPNLFPSPREEILAVTGLFNLPSNRRFVDRLQIPTPYMEATLAGGEELRRSFPEAEVWVSVMQPESTGLGLGLVVIFTAPQAMIFVALDPATPTDETWVALDAGAHLQEAPARRFSRAYDALFDWLDRAYAAGMAREALMRESNEGLSAVLTRVESEHV